LFFFYLVENQTVLSEINKGISSYNAHEDRQNLLIAENISTTILSTFNTGRLSVEYSLAFLK